ncbi:MAG: phosphatidylglycerol lysyltransferase domain-containing protein, partial [Pyrinomonadaceae bacterium]
ASTDLPRHENPAIARAREIVLSHGWNSTSFQIVNPGIKRWFSDRGDAVVGYVVSTGVRVVAGAPVCAKERLAEVTAEFEANARANKERVCYFCAESMMESQLTGSTTHSKFLLGAQPIWRPIAWPQIIAANRSLRAQLNRARNKGVRVNEWPIEKARAHPELVECLRQWLASKGLPPLHFMVESDTLERLENRRVFVAQLESNIVGFVVLSPVRRRNGWLFEQFPHRPGAPNGTVELMIDTAMRALAGDGFDFATLGLSPLSKRADVEPLDNPIWFRLFLAWLRKHGQRFYNFDGLDAFKAKLKPEGWEPVYAVSNEPRISSRTLYAIAGAFSGNATGKMVFGGLGKAAVTEARWIKRRLARIVDR